MKTPRFFLSLCLFLCAAAPAEPKSDPAAPPFDIKEHYTKYEYRIPMRDGVRLFTAVYVPKDRNFLYPFLVLRTPYSVGAVQGDEHNYGPDQYPGAPRHLGPSEDFDKSGYIFVFQDVRGRFLSEGKWDELRPHIDDKKSPQDTDESSDMHDTPPPPPSIGCSRTCPKTMAASASGAFPIRDFSRPRASSIPTPPSRRPRRRRR